MKTFSAHLQGDNKLGTLLSRQINVTKFTLSKGPANLKVVKLYV